MTIRNRLLFGWQLIGSLPLEHAAEFQELFLRNFPDRETAYLSDIRGARMFCYPPLDQDDLDKWEEVYERLNKALGLPT